MTDTFTRLGLGPALVRTLADQGINHPFPIQAATIPDGLAGRDVCGKAPTGSGKTLAFGLAVLSRVGRAGRNRPRALILAPTRELAAQIDTELTPLGRAVDRRVATVHGGVSYGPQRAALRKGADVLVATPGRLEDLMEQGSVDLGEIEVVVVDEADRMADMGFLPAVRRILRSVPQSRQTLLFSATLDGEIAVLSREFQSEPVRHEAASVAAEHGEVEHRFWAVDQAARLDHTVAVVRSAGRSIVFARTRHGADRLAKQLTREGVEAVAMHGGRSQNQRTKALRRFASGTAVALVATDVAARGIDVDDVAAVVHFDPPADAKDYTHRSGRTGRAGATGIVVTMVTKATRGAVRRLIRELELDASVVDPSESDLPGLDRVVSDPHESVYVANLPWSTTSEDLRRLFSRHGAVRSSEVISDRRSGRSKGYGFVEMPSGSAGEAIAALHGHELGGRDLTVRIARPQKVRS